jgi:hypothetical protein
MFKYSLYGTIYINNYEKYCILGFIDAFGRISAQLVASLCRFLLGILLSHEVRVAVFLRNVGLCPNYMALQPTITAVRASNILIT